MMIQKAKAAIRKVKADRVKARELLVKALILEAGANPRKVKIVEVDGFRSLVRSLIPVN